MRSYYAHLESLSRTIHSAVSPRPVLRSSAIFPVIHTSEISARILFMGYWILKRNIKELTSVVTLRTKEGISISRSISTISEAKCYRIELIEELHKANWSDPTFEGSLEIEFFSVVHLVFPFPAVSINYYGPHFSSIVHSAQRIYNDFEDMQNNSQTAVPESGFNIYAEADREPFIGIINGPYPVTHSTFRIQFYNHRKEILAHEHTLGTLAPYQTEFLYPARWVDLDPFLDHHVGTVKIGFDLKGIFPRVIAGNFFHRLPAMMITHSYYDCSGACSDSDYWQPYDPEYYPAFLMLPFAFYKGQFTKISFYPIYSPSTFTISIELYDPRGDLLGGMEKIIQIDSSYGRFQQIYLESICQELNIHKHQDLGIRVIAKKSEGTPEEEPLPARIKIALDRGFVATQAPCNICVNLQPFNPDLKKKQHSFRWAPLLTNTIGASAWIMNSSPAISYQQQAEILLTFFRESDTMQLERVLLLPPHGFYVIRPDEDPELKLFFQNKIGWFTAVTNNPYISVYYFTEHPAGTIGGDHGF